jgi:acyl carrier protein
MENAHREKIKKYILENFLFSADSAAIHDDVSFLGSGIVDSTGILEIIGFLEEEFHIHVEDEEVIPENLDSIDRVAKYVERKIGKNASV